MIVICNNNVKTLDLALAKYTVLSCVIQKGCMRIIQMIYGLNFENRIQAIFLCPDATETHDVLPVSVYAIA